MPSGNVDDDRGTGGRADVYVESGACSGSETLGDGGVFPASPESVEAAPIPPLGPPLDRMFRVRFPWPGYSTDVCYRKIGQLVPDDFRMRVRDLVENNWMRLIEHELVGWTMGCPDLNRTSDALIAISVVESGSSSATVGWPGFYHYGEVVLNANAGDAEILYVFGRALGFDHEYGDCRPCSTKEDCAGVGESQLCATGLCDQTTREPKSIMADPACADPLASRSSALSPWDVAGAQRAYPLKPSGAVVGTNGKCLNVHGSEPDVGAQLQLYSCSNRDNDTWYSSLFAESGAPGTSSDRLHVIVAGRSLCAGPAENKPETRLLSAACDTDAMPQGLHFGPASLRTVGGLCVAATGMGPDAGLKGIKCNSADNTQRWQMVGRQIELAGTSLYITAGLPGAEGSALAVEPAGAGRQTFRFEHKRIIDETSGLCFNLYGGPPIAGSDVKLYSCAGDPPNEVFYLDGPLHDGSLCVGLLDGQPAEDEGQVGVVTCNGTESQSWQYYW